MKISIAINLSKEEQRLLVINASKFMKTRGFSSKNKRIFKKKISQLIIKIIENDFKI